MSQARQRISGVTIYAVEGVVWAALEAGWISLRLAMADSLLDQSILAAAALLSVFHLLLSSALGDSPKTEEAYFNAVLPMWITYAALVGDAAVAPARLDRALFGGLTLFLVPAAISLAFLTVQTLLAAAAASRDGPLWRPEGMWLDGSILLLTAAHACISNPPSVGLGLSSTVLSLHILFLGSLGARLWEFDVEQHHVGSITAQYFLEIVHLCLIALICIITVVESYISGTTVWALILALAPLVALSVVRLVAWKPKDQAQHQPPPQDDTQPSAPPASLVFAHPNPAPAMPFAQAGAAMGFAQPGGTTRLLAPPSRPVVKKQL
jgi:hypothetical protein